MKKVTKLTRIEFATSYRFPMLEGLVALFFFLLFWNTLGGWSTRVFGIGQFDRINYVLGSLVPSRLFFGASPFASLMAILVPILVALSIAKPFEDGYIRTLATYPLRRSSILITKILLIIVVPATTISTALLCAIALVYPGFPAASDISIVLISIWLMISLQTAVCTIIAVFSKRLSITALFGVGFWFVVIVILGQPDTSPLLVSTLNPIRAATEFVWALPTAPVFGDIVGGAIIAFVLSVLLTITSIIVFSRMEI
ncbi:MAG: hypothetical protein P1Q69_03665 [Candidatus Thorarchaeota archaeon]|nr:hypothetical protein [Candidatus Thorarchaeota archaeon]